ncbi:hypothetical protein [Burkholderia oklahomensis]|uniref:Uncharacterized protein n=1 Tax=Burkholderia oklahomensis TaxID=342113 RepID=A0AAI8FRE5_9BURK|nr:hypothetical protein [Burkholderia oklahomensis]AIO70159.1 hypothetical protein DM82_5875 [Burkholderia oklahomensis]QPS40860.1 hypothetical protein I6G57_21520 [Burkholderia oklahomensis]
MDATRISGTPGTTHIQGHSEGDASAQHPPRSVSPRRVPTNELLQNNLKRFVRKEKETPLPSQDPVNIPHISSAMHKLNVEKNRLAKHKENNAEQISQGKIPAAVKTSEANIKKFEASLQQARNAGSLGTEEFKKLAMQHAKSSSNSPFLSGTPEYTVGQNSQESYANDSIARGQPAVFSVLHTDRALTNPANSREHELLLPVAEYRREVAGTFTMEPGGDKTYVDTSSDQSVTYHGEDAQQKFEHAAGKLNTQK